MRNTRRPVIRSVVGASLLCSFVAAAQTTDPPGPTASGKIVKPNSPFSQIETSVGVAVEELCPSLVGRTRAGQNNAAQLDLQVRCTEMVVAQDSNGVSGGGTADVLRAATAEEVATQGTQVVELSALRGANILARLTELRTASSGGSSFAFNDKSGVVDFSHDFGGSAGDETFSPWSIYVNGSLTTGDREETPEEAGFDFDGGAITVGADYRWGDSTFLGAALTWATADADLLNGGNVETDGLGIIVYGTTYLKNDVYLEGTLGFGSHDYDQVRKISYDVPNAGGSAVTQVRQDANSSTNGDDIVASVGIGKDFARDATTISLSGNLTYLDATIDGYQETISNNSAPGFGLALEVDKQTIESLRSVIGVQVSRAISTSRGVTIPYARVDWVHEFKNDVRNTRARFDNDPFTTGGFFLPSGAPAASTFSLVTEAPDEDYFRLGAGVSTVWAGGWQGFVALDTLLGLRNIDAYGLVAGVRKDL